MKIATGDIMRRIDKRAVQESGIKSEVLMENAGLAVADFVSDLAAAGKPSCVLVLCGKGNNGGDGLVAARLLAKKKNRVLAVMFARKEEVAGDVKLNLAKCAKENVKVRHITLSKDFEDLKKEFTSCDVIVDALLGTGFRGAVSGFLSNVMDFVNSCPGLVVSVDLPSGLNSSTGQIAGACVKADYTVTFGLNKLGLCIHPGLEYAGQVLVADIGLPETAVDRENIRTNLVEAADAALLFPERRPDCNKGSLGRVFIAGGSPGMTGAPCMSGLSALRSGCGLVTLGVPESSCAIVESKTLELMTRPLPETAAKTFSLKAGARLLEMLQGYNVLALGPGLGRDKDTASFVRMLVAECPIPLVLDADGLTLMANHVEDFAKTKAPVIITPHPGEMSRLIGVNVDFVQGARVETAREFAKRFGVVVVLKGARTVTASPEGEVFVNSTGNCGMATAGTGDVLTGVIASFVAQGAKPLNAAILGTYIHGLAGDLAKNIFGEHGLIASDVTANIPAAIRNTLSK